MVQSLTVLHVNTERGWRGGERQALWLAQGLEALGHQSIVVARPGEPFAQKASAAGLRVIELEPKGELDAFAGRRLRRLAAAIGKPDIVHAHTAHALATVAWSGIEAPVIASRRVDFPIRKGLASRWKYGRAAKIIAVSDAVRNVMIASGIDPARIDVVHDGADITRTPSRPISDIRAGLESLGVPRDAPLAVQVAALVPHKDPLNLVAAMDHARRSVPNAHALIVGAGPLRDAVNSAVAERGLERTVHVLGFRDDADDLLAAADVVTLSSAEEGMGSVLIDALVFGRPVAATRAGGIPEVVDEGITGLLAPIRDPQGLGAAIARLLSNKDLRESMGAAGRARAERFSVGRMAERTLAVYGKVLEHGPRLSPG